MRERVIACLYICFALVCVCISASGGGGGGGGQRYVFCKSGIITIPHLNISIPFAMFNLLRGAIFQGQILRGGGGGFSGGNSPITDTSHVKWFVPFNFSRLAGDRNKQIYYAIMFA